MRWRQKVDRWCQEVDRCQVVDASVSQVQVDVAKIAPAISMSRQSMQSVSGTFNVCSVIEKKN